MKKKVYLTRPERREQAAVFAKRSEVVLGDVSADAAPSRTRGRARLSPACEANDLGGGPPLKGGTTTPFSDKKSIQENSIENLLERASTLSVKDQKELLARLSLAANSKGTDRDRDVEMWSGALYNALVSVLGPSGVPGTAVIKKLVRSAEAWNPVEEFMQTSKLQEQPVIKRQAIYNLLAKLVVEDTREFCAFMALPFGVKTTVNRSSNIAGTFNKAFPGYIQAGLVGLIASRLGR